MVDSREMSVGDTAIGGLRHIRSKAVTDERGTVREFFRTSGYETLGVSRSWSQINMTWTWRGGLRGLHGEAMTKLVGVAAGEAHGAYLDARRDSPSFGRVVTLDLAVGDQVLVPPGVCNGFQAVTDCQYLYCFDAEWQPGMAGVAVNPLDPALGIVWPITPPTVSAKDAAAPLFAEL